MITQQTFDDVVRENMAEFEMSAEEAVNDAKEQFQSQVRKGHRSNKVKGQTGSQGHRSDRVIRVANNFKTPGAMWAPN